MQVSSAFYGGVLEVPGAATTAVIPIARPDPPEATAVEGSVSFVVMGSLKTAMPVWPAWERPTVLRVATTVVGMDALVFIMFAPVTSTTVSSSQATDASLPVKLLEWFGAGVMVGAAGAGAANRIICLEVPVVPLRPLIGSPPFSVDLQVVSTAPEITVTGWSPFGQDIKVPAAGTAITIAVVPAVVSG